MVSRCSEWERVSPWKAGLLPGLTVLGGGVSICGGAGKGPWESWEGQHPGGAMMDPLPGCTFKERPLKMIYVHQSRDGQLPTVSTGDCVSHTQQPR